MLAIVFFLFRYVKDGKIWASSHINNHISEAGNLMQADEIIDRNGTVLAKTENKKRVYNESPDIRRAMLHVVGDGGGAISTAVQSKYRHELVDYNPITGLALNFITDRRGGLRLTLDSNICAKIQNRFGSKNGAALLYNYKTGEILCMISAPTFDPVNPPKIDLNNPGAYEGVYLNKVLSASLTPGSIFKIITAAAAIENIPDLYNKKFNCEKIKAINSDSIICESRHGKLDIKDAFAKSCNISFGELAMEIGAEKMESMANMLGFNRNMSIEDIDLQPSHYESKSASLADLAWSGIGQYKNLVNPMHMALILGAIANKGLPVVPYMVESKDGLLGLLTKHTHGMIGQRLLKESTAEKVKELMRYAVKTQYSDSTFPGLSVCAKTGTAEVGNSQKATAWMVGFAQDEDVPLAFVVAVENSGSGFKVAAPIAQEMLELGKKIYRKS